MLRLSMAKPGCYLPSVLPPKSALLSAGLITTTFCYLSPNGTKTTHAMVCKLTHHPSDIIHSQNVIGVMLLKILRPKEHELASLRLASPFNWLITTALPNWTYLLCLPWLSHQNRLCKLTQQGLGHEMRHVCPVYTQKILMSSGRGSTLT